MGVNPLVAIIIPMYNLEGIIGRTLDCLVNQTYRNIEIIIVDDGSTDDSYALVEKYRKSDSRISIYRQANAGVSAARNTGISHAIESDYFLFVDGDDWVSCDYVQTLLEAALMHNADIVSSRIYPSPKWPIGKSDTTVDIREAQVLSSEDAILELLYDGRIKNHTPAKLFKTSIFGAYRFDTDFSVGEDMEFLFRALSDNNLSSIALVGGSLYRYIQRAGSAMNSTFSEKRASSLGAALKMSATSNLSSSLQKALNVKLFTEAFSIATLSRSAGVGYVSIYNMAVGVVRENMWKTLFNSRAKTSQRIYAAVSIINIRLATRLAGRDSK